MASWKQARKLRDLLGELRANIAKLRRGLTSKSQDILAHADMLSELSPEMESQMLDGLANTVVRWGLETPAIYFLETMKPLAVYTSSLTITVGAPILEIFGISGYKYAALFQKRDSVERLMRRIEEKVRHGKAVS